MKKIDAAPIIIGKLLNIGAMLKKNGDRMLLPYGINQQQLSILNDISVAGRIKQKDLVNRLLLEKSNVSKIVKKLESLELIKLESCEKDKRSFFLLTTEKGKQMHNEILDMLKVWNGSWIEKVEDKNIQAILDCLTDLQVRLKDEINK